MHDISLERTIIDYLTGESIEDTTYEDLRQSLARMLVEERGYPKDRLRPRVAVTVPIDGRLYSRIVDLAAYGEDNAPLLVLIFCSGAVNTYCRECLAAARLFPQGPAPFVCVTDSKNALLIETDQGEIIHEGMGAIPIYQELVRLAGERPIKELTPEQAAMEARILYAYSESLLGCCGHATCAAEAKGGRFSQEAS